MFQAQLIQPPQQCRRIDSFILLLQPTPSVRQTEQRICVCESRTLQYCQQRLQKGMKRRSPDWLPGGIKLPDVGIAKRTLKMRDHVRVSRANTDRLVDIFFVPLQPIGYVAGL